MQIKKYKKFKYKYLLLAGLVVAPAIIASSIILVQKLDKQYLLFDNKIFSSTKALANYLNKNKEISSLKMNAKSFSFDNQVFNTTQQFYEYLTNKFNIDEKLTNKIPGNYTIDGAGELSKDVLIDDNDQALKVYQGKNGLAYLNRKEALDSYINYKKTYTVEGKEFNIPYEVKEYLTNSKLKELEEKDEKSLVYKNGSLMQSETEIKTWLHKNLKNGFEYQGKIFSDYNYKEFLNYFQHLDSSIIDENVTEVLNPDKSSYWINLDDKSVDGYFIGPKYVETSSKLGSMINEGFQTIDSFTPNLISGFASLSILNEVVSLDYTSKTQGKDINWEDGLNDYIKELNREKIISDNLFKEMKPILFPEQLSQINQIVQDSTANLDQIDGDEFTDFHRLLVVMKRIMVPARIYSGLNPIEIERVLKQLLIEILAYNHQTDDQDQSLFFSLTEDFKDRKLEEIITLFLDPADFYQSNEGKESALAMIKKVDSVIDGIIGGIDKTLGIKKKIDDLKKSYQDSNKNEDNLNEKRKETNQTIIVVLEENADDVLKALNIKNNEDTSTFGLGLGGIFKWLSIGWEILNTFSFISVKTLEYKIDEYQSIYYVAPTYKIPILNIEGDVKNPLIDVTKLNSSPLDYMLPKKTNDKNEVTKIYELEGKYYLDKENALEELRSKIYLNPEKYIPCKKIFTSIYENDEGYQLPDRLVNAKIIKKEGDEKNPNAITHADYLKALAEERDKYVNQLFDTYFKPNAYHYFVDGLGNYFTTKEEAINSVKENIQSNNFENYLSYSYITRSGKKFIAQTEEEILDFIQKNELIDSKTIMSTELIKTSVYDRISDYSNIYFSVFELDFYGDKKYFVSETQLWTFLLNKLDYKINHYQLDTESYNYQDYYFKSDEEFLSWVELNTKKINSFQIKGKEVITDEK